MPMVFRKSVLGFNKEDVLKYINELFDKITKLEEKSKEKEQELNNEISDLNACIDGANKNIEALIAENERVIKVGDGLRNDIAVRDEEIARLNSLLDVYRSKEQEINDIAEIIGKLYMVSKLNADTIIRTAHESKLESEAEVRRNIDAIEDAQRMFDDLKSSAQLSASEFRNGLDRLIASLDTAKDKLSSNDDNISNAESGNYDLMKAADIEM